MSAPSITRTPLPGGREPGFGALLRAEWVKFRSVRGWVAGMILAGLLIAGLGIFLGANASIGCQINNGPVKTGKACEPPVPHGPGGEVVSDSFSLVSQPLTGNGSITARVTGLAGKHVSINGGGAQASSSNGPDLVPGLVDWAKAGVIIKQSTKPGSAYAAMMVTGAHGTRMQDDFTTDIAGPPAKAPAWLRLTRSGDTLTGYESADGTHWTRVGTATLAGLPRTVQAGMFATSPGYSVTQNSFGGSSHEGGPAQATGTFDDVRLAGAAPGGSWHGTAVSGGGPIGGNGPPPPAYTQAGGTFTVTGAGDIAPVTPGDQNGFPTVTIQQPLAAAFIGLIAIVAVAAMFFTSEYRRGLIRTTLAATPRRGAVLAAKATVAGAVAFAAGLVAASIAVGLGVPREENKGLVLLPAPVLTEIRVVVGTAAVLALAAVIAVALGAILRRSAAAITVAVLIVVLPFLLNGLNAVPAGVGAWLLRLTPAAGLAIQQSIPRYPQVDTVLSPIQGYYPLPPYAGFAVLCLWAAGAVALAVFLLRRRDA